MTSLLLLCLSRPKKDQKKSQCNQSLGEFGLYFTPLLPALGGEVCGWVGTPNVSPPPILTHARRKNKLSGQKHTIAFPQEKLFVNPDSLPMPGLFFLWRQK